MQERNSIIEDTHQYFLKTEILEPGGKRVFSIKALMVPHYIPSLSILICFIEISFLLGSHPGSRRQDSGTVRTGRGHSVNSNPHRLDNHRLCQCRHHRRGL